MPVDPIALFAELFEKAKAAIPVDPNAMVLASVSKDGRPSARVVLLKEFSAAGFVFYTNLESRKGRELTAHPWAALCFHWKPVEKQVRIEGRVEQVSDTEADAYFATRARGSQLGAWASQQSAVLDRRETLDARLAEAETRFAHQPVSRPPYWSGFRVVPDRIEVWTNRADRLHERQLFVRSNGNWAVEFLYP